MELRMYCSSAHSTILYRTTEKDSGFILRIRNSVLECFGWVETFCSSRRGLMFPAGRRSGFSGYLLSFGRFSQAFGNRRRVRKSWVIYWAPDASRSCSSTVKQLSSLNTRSFWVTAVFLYYKMSIVCINYNKENNQKGVGLLTCRKVKIIRSCHMITTDTDNITVSFQRGNKTETVPLPQVLFCSHAAVFTAQWTTVTLWWGCRTGGYSRSFHTPLVCRLLFSVALSPPQNTVDHGCCLWWHTDAWRIWFNSVWLWRGGIVCEGRRIITKKWVIWTLWGLKTGKSCFTHKHNWNQEMKSLCFNNHIYNKDHGKMVELLSGSVQPD